MPHISYLPMGQGPIDKPNDGMSDTAALAALKRKWSLKHVPSFEVWAPSHLF